MSEKKKKKGFIKLPRYLGDKGSFRKFIAANLVYPEEARKLGIEGTVHLSYRVDDNGDVHDISVDHGIGHGCDEEALRLVMMMKFTPVKNRGVKVSSKQRTRIEFKLPKPAFTYNMTTKKESTKETEQAKVTYTYTIKTGKEGS